ncbi:hypothetical protein M413DRAFT_439069 [Hebeloma cylindrosporum]|uniref:Uncharacterized protein n=1 Tax=Hebeloma cylindrosporum TaxID=76867 RepID=A0A0C3CTG2_HEBCY|nr:hypothetical protein M413DRAFT_439069 [Hebeloma cylindrosporum h7]
MSTPRFSEEEAPKKLPGLQDNSDGLLSEYEAEYAEADLDSKDERGTVEADKQERYTGDALETMADSSVLGRAEDKSSTDKTAAAIQKEEAKPSGKKN